MNEDQFWEIVERSIPDESDSLQNHENRYRQSISSLSAEEMIRFQLKFDELKWKADTPRLSQAVYIVTNGCGDDDFQSFVAGLIAQGRKVFYHFLEDPESMLLSLPNPERFERYEIFDCIPIQIYEERVGQHIYANKPIPDDGENRDLERRLFLEEYTEDPQDLKLQFPKLFAKFWRAPGPTSVAETNEGLL